MSSIKTIIILLISFILIGCSEKTIITYPLTCDMENINEGHFICNSHHKIKHAANQSSDYAKSGKYSAKIDQLNPFGLVHTIKHLKKGNQIIISVWEKADQNKGYLKLCKNDGTILKVKSRAIITKKEEWILITLSYVLDSNYNSLKFYIHNDNQKPAYYDDLKIEVFDKVRKVDLGDEDIQLIISDNDFEILAKIREIALKNGIIDKSLKKYIEGTLIYKKEKIPIEMRFKGDWPDHLVDDKWSFRIKVKGDHSFKGLKSFSIQSPHTRTFLKEWVMHQIFKKEDILTTRYDFISVMLNGKSLGIYACEEHFDKQLLESNQRREAPILKFNEEGLWETRLNNPNNKSLFPFYEAAEVMPFKKNRTLKSPTLRKNLITGNELMLKYKEFYSDLSTVFDLDKMAKFYALCDLGKIRHSYHWHNQRFYIDPISKKLEHIAFDCYAGIEEGINDVIYGYSNKDKSNYNSEFISKQIFNNKEFNELYKNYLITYSSKDYINKMKDQYEELSDSLTKIIQQEFPNYQFNLNYIEKQAEDIRKLISKYNVYYDHHCYDVNYNDIDINNKYFKSIGIKAYLKNKLTENLEVTLDNYHLAKVKVIGYSSSKSIDSIIYFNHPLELKPYKKDQKSVLIKIPLNSKYLFIQPLNNQNTYSVKINQWAYHSKNLKNTADFDYKNNLDQVTIDSINKKIYLYKGNHLLSKSIIIPKGWDLNIEAGTKINLTNNSSIISYSPVFLKGSKEQPISISSSDNSGMGLIVLNAELPSKMDHVTFNHLQSNSINNWTLTGAVTFYESDVTINHCSFNHNNSEDALNVIRSNFSLFNCSFNHTLSDAFDADFCDGNMKDCIFKSAGNDAIDLSGSHVTIDNVTVENAKDKAISNGERSYLKIINANINNANIAIASKDDSKLEIEKITISNCKVGYAAFQKKPEFSPAYIEIKSSNETNISELFLIDFDSKINYLDDIHIGITHINVDSLYVPYKKGI